MSLKKNIKRSRYIRNVFLTLSVILLILDMVLFYVELNKPITNLTIVYAIYYVLCATMLVFLISAIINLIFRLKARKKADRKAMSSKSNEIKTNKKDSKEHLEKEKPVVVKESHTDPVTGDRISGMQIHRTTPRKKSSSDEMLTTLERDSISIDNNVNEILEKVSRKRSNN